MDILYQKQIPVRYETDVFIAGGGPAGIAAAVSCARTGHSVFLAESFSAFGGAAVTMLVPAFMAFGDSKHFFSGRDRPGSGQPYQRSCFSPLETLLSALHPR